MWERQFAEVLSVSGRQLGLFTVAQAARIGLDPSALRHLAEAGLISRGDWDVYEVTGNPVGMKYSLPFSGWLAFAPERFRWERPQVPVEDAVVSHESAANLYGLSMVPSPFMVLTAPTVGPSMRATTVHMDRLAPEDVTVHQGVPVTTPRRTLVDLIRIGLERDKLVRAIEAALWDDLIDLGEFHGDLVRLAGEYRLPVDGPEFLETFAPNVRPHRLSPRNQRGYALLRFPDRVAAVQESVRQLLAEVAPVAVPATGGPPADSLALDVAASIVARAEPL